jgi:hypothetical protein
MLKVATQDSGLTEEEIDDVIFATKAFLIVLLILVIVIDFFVRFLVIDSLYHRYKEDGKPKQVV